MNKSDKTNVAVATATVAAVAVMPTEAQLVEAGFDNLSKRIRELHRLGMKVGEIAKVVTRSNGEHPRYQHVRNVILTPLKKVVEVAEVKTEEVAA